MEKIKGLIETLKNINIKDTIDTLQNIDAKELGNILRERVDIVVNVVLILMTVIVTINITHGYGKKTQILTGDIRQKQDRLEAVNESKRLQDEYAVFLQSFPRSILTDQLINKLSEFAADREVQILSFSPLKEKNDEYIKVFGVQINVASESYRNIVLFMRDIEDSPYALKVDHWLGKMKEHKAKEGTQETKKRLVEVSMSINAIKLKDDENK